MPLYNVELAQTTTCTVKVQIEAPNADLAADMAQEHAVKEMNGGGTPPWGRTDWSEIEDQNIEVTDAPWTDDEEEE